MIRPATPADVPLLVSLIRELAAYEHLTEQCHASEFLLAEHLFGDKPAAEAVILLSDTPEHAAVGYALYYPTFSTFLARPGLYLEDIYVQPGYRNRGLGKSVFAFLAKLCAARNYGRLEWTVLDWNAPSIAFYETLGAKRMAEWQIMRLTGAELEKMGAA